jgi:hypothetical protein
MVPIGRLLRQKKRPRDATEPTDNDGDAGSMGKPVAKAVKLSDLDSMISRCFCFFLMFLGGGGGLWPPPRQRQR